MVLAQLGFNLRYGLQTSREGRRLFHLGGATWRSCEEQLTNCEEQLGGAVRSNWAGAWQDQKRRSWMTCESESTVILFVVHISLLLLHYPTDMVFVTACQHTVLTWFLHLLQYIYLPRPPIFCLTLVYTTFFCPLFVHLIVSSFFCVFSEAKRRIREGKALLKRIQILDRSAR